MWQRCLGTWLSSLHVSEQLHAWRMMHVCKNLYFMLQNSWYASILSKQNLKILNDFQLLKACLLLFMIFRLASLGVLNTFRCKHLIEWNTFEFMKVMGTDKISLTAGPAIVKGVLYISCQVKFSLPLHTVIQWADVGCSVHSSMPLSVARQRALWMCSR